MAKTVRTAAHALAAARAAALELPETTEAPHFDMASFRVRGKIFATVPPQADRLHLFVPPDVAHAFVAENPEAFAELWWGKKLYGLIASVPAASEADVAELLEAAWREKAPKRVVAGYDAATATGATSVSVGANDANWSYALTGSSIVV